jgi:hypothetical protein
MLVGVVVQMEAALHVIAVGGTLVKATLWHGDGPYCCDWLISA